MKSTVILKASLNYFIVFIFSLYLRLLFLESNIYYLPIDNSTNGEVHSSRSTLISSHSFNNTIDHLFFTPTHPKPSVLSQQTSRRMKNMVRRSCHKMFLLQCRDHDFIPKGLLMGGKQSKKPNKPHIVTTKVFVSAKRPSLAAAG